MTLRHGALRIMGIDPGLGITGYGVVDFAPRPTLVEGGVIRANARQPLAARVKTIFDGISEAMADCQPTTVVIEELYSTYGHPRTAILMAHARGVICLAAARAGVDVASYPATEVKRALTGSGRASKAQIQRVVQQRLRLRALPQPADLADALALALCHGQRWGRR